MAYATEHTKTPWAVGPYGGVYSLNSDGIHGPLIVIGETKNGVLPNRDENEAFIVVAVNAYGTLVAQNEWLKDRLSDLQLPSNSTKNIEEWLVGIIDDILQDLDEALGFAAMSPAGRENIKFALDNLPDRFEQKYRDGFVDGEKHAHECIDIQGRRSEQRIEELQQVLKEYVCECAGPCHAESYGGPCGRAAYAALRLSERN